MASRPCDRSFSGSAGKIMANPLPSSSPVHKRLHSGRKNTPAAAAAAAGISGKENVRSISVGRCASVPKLFDKPTSFVGARASSSELTKAKPASTAALPRLTDFSRSASALRGAGVAGRDRKLARASSADRILRSMTRDTEAEMCTKRRSGAGGKGDKDSEARKSASRGKVLERDKSVCKGRVSETKENSGIHIAKTRKVEFFHDKIYPRMLEKPKICKASVNKDPPVVILNLETIENEMPNHGATVREDARIEVSDIGAVMEEPLEKEVAILEVEDKKSDDRVSVMTNNEPVSAPDNKYPSKLHEKLALLDGRVRRIAGEINQAKAMLDANNPKESKLILSDIHKKISAIERAMGHGSVEDNTIQDSRCSERSAEILAVEKAEKERLTVKSISGEELEARFFPHYKLLRDQKSSPLSTENAPPTINKENGRKAKDAALDHVSEESIVMELLASLTDENIELVDHVNAKPSELAASSETGTCSNSLACSSLCDSSTRCCKEEIDLLATEKLEEFDDQQKEATIAVKEDFTEACNCPLHEIGSKSSAGGWFVSEGEAVLLAHCDGSCSYYDIANCEFKTEYKSPDEVPCNIWGDCWIIRAPGADGCSGKYVVAASAGSTLDSGFCSWDFYSRDVKAFHVDESSDSLSRPGRKIRGPLSDVGSSAPAASVVSALDSTFWWYRPCGPLLLSTFSRQKMVTAYDVRDGDLIMKWELSSPVAGIEHSCPIQWRSRGKVVIAGTESVSLWDVNSVTPQSLFSITSAGKRVCSLHVNNTDAEPGSGIRQRVSSSEVEGNDGVFCTQDSVNLLDFRLPTGIGLKILRQGGLPSSIFSQRDSILVGSTERRLQIKGGGRSQVQQYSIKKGKLVTAYELPESASSFHHSLITQVWGNADIVMAASRMGVFVYDALKEEGIVRQSLSIDQGSRLCARETMGGEGMQNPSFDYADTRVLLISRDRPACWRYLM